MGELRSRADGLERKIILIIRELNAQKDEVASLVGEIKYITDKAEKLEEENEKQKRQIESMEKEHAREISKFDKQ